MRRRWVVSGITQEITGSLVFSTNRPDTPLRTERLENAEDAEQSDGTVSAGIE